MAPLSWRHHTVLQALLSRVLLPEPDFQPLLTDISGGKNLGTVSRLFFVHPAASVARLRPSRTPPPPIPSGPTAATLIFLPPPTRPATPPPYPVAAAPSLRPATDKTREVPSHGAASTAKTRDVPSHGAAPTAETHDVPSRGAGAPLSRRRVCASRSRSRLLCCLWFYSCGDRKESMNAQRITYRLRRYFRSIWLKSRE
ncbi:hypothetical protein BRADI_2g55860v3 [Brachypodium distachyon]|uniref:Uncharacterized protein n=1 Tax=Brachypodium distachyon TaxID=15368 RepID=I1HTP0_BRADI|nr:hypothetical protein BRADI_2g55860v3 [Brachypodium distachyon]